MNVKELFPSRWVEPEDLGNKRVTVEITRAGLEEIFNRQTNAKEMKLALSFKGAKKQMLINKTQALKICEITGHDDTDQWVGKSITIRAGVAPNRKPTIVVEAPPVTAPAVNLNTSTEQVN